MPVSDFLSSCMEVALTSPYSAPQPVFGLGHELAGLYFGGDSEFILVSMVVLGAHPGASAACPRWKLI